MPLCPSWTPCPYIKTSWLHLLDHLPHFSVFVGGHIAAFEIDDKRCLPITGAFIDTSDVVKRFSGDSLRLSLLKIARAAKCPDLSGDRYRSYCAAIFLTNPSKGRVYNLLPEVVDEYLKTPTEDLGELDDAHISYAIEDMLSTRCFCLTAGDRFAWVPDDSTYCVNSHDGSLGDDTWKRTEPGNKICVFEGGSLPYVLRQRADGAYTLIGECWIQGLMHGEALDLPGFKTETFVIV
ncbi:hypothetical protein BU23DRAFT_168914 [Bimuria novae-zelandiae CBS 107.79]|uniref:Heterokaryon incompatibility domain-containing protein n=1 Tax=Bimuria novae-zelandiae CBS 107.79 TaxID=1447943 RepID=A0A6A5V3F6_9PLEO|nr:hypothetical protein BU23DRAFT_168914 [Bimuria novae-zelandiae CBS 107.79]